MEKRVLVGNKMENEEENRIEQQYSDLIKTFEKDNFESLENNLDSNQEKTLGALRWATEKGRLKVCNEMGRQIWKKAIDYLSKNKFTEDLSEIEETLSQINSPIKRRLYVALDSFLGGMCTGITFAGVNGYRVADRLIQKHDHKNVTRLLYVEFG